MTSNQFGAVVRAARHVGARFQLWLLDWRIRAAREHAEAYRRICINCAADCAQLEQRRRLVQWRLL